MSDYIGWIATASREELEAPVKMATKEAIRRAHEAGVRTVGTRDGVLVMSQPTGQATQRDARKTKPTR